jgi:hypothetical protein
MENENQDPPPPPPPSQFGSLLSQIEYFYGTPTHGPNIKNFLESIDTIGTLGNWTENNKITVAKLRLKDQALLFKDTHATLKECADWREFQNILIDRFDTKEPAVYRLQKFIQARQAPTEKVQQFATRIRCLGLKTIDEEQLNALPVEEKTVRLQVLEENVLNYFLLGLHEDIRRLTMSHSPHTFQDAVKVAQQEELNSMISKDFALPKVEVNQLNRTFNNPLGNNAQYNYSKEHREAQGRNVQRGNFRGRPRGSLPYTPNYMHSPTSFPTSQNPPYNTRGGAQSNYGRGYTLTRNTRGPSRPVMEGRGRYFYPSAPKYEPRSLANPQIQYPTNSKCQKCRRGGHDANACSYHSVLKCYICNTEGHYANECRKAKNQCTPASINYIHADHSDAPYTDPPNPWNTQPAQLELDWVEEQN